MEQEQQPSSHAHAMQDYRRHLMDAAQKSQESFDKTVLTLSGGALGVSFVFLKDVISGNPIHSPALLLLAWGAWGLSSLLVLASYYFSHAALRKAINQVDDGTIEPGKAGGWYTKLTAYLNAAGAILFTAGVFLIITFAWNNLITPTTTQEGTHKNERQQTNKRPGASDTDPSTAPKSDSTGN